MADIKIELTGAQELAKKIGALTVKEMPTMVHGAVSQGAKQIEQSAKMNAMSVFTSGYSTGQTRDNIQVYFDRGGAKGALAKIGVLGEGFSTSTSVGGDWTRTPIGYFWEYGFWHGKRGSPNRKEMPERRFMRPALDDNAGPITADIRVAIEQAIRRL